MRDALAGKGDKTEPLFILRTLSRRKRGRPFFVSKVFRKRAARDSGGDTT